MKALFSLIFVFFALASYGQLTVVKDTVYFEQVGQDWYRVSYKLFSNNNDEQKREYISAEQVDNTLVTTVANATSAAAGGAVSYLNSLPFVRKTITDLNTLYQARTGRSIYMALADLYFEENAGNYEYFIDNVSQGADFTFNRPAEPGNVRFSRDATNYQGVFFSNNAFLMFIGATPVGLFKVGLNEAGRPVWKSIDEKYEMRGK
jgi:hypothetical protein